MPARDSKRQHAAQQLGCGPVPGDWTGFVVLVVDLGPTGRRLPRPQTQRVALASVRGELGNLDPRTFLQHRLELKPGGTIALAAVGLKCQLQRRTIDRRQIILALSRCSFPSRHVKHLRGSCGRNRRPPRASFSALLAFSTAGLAAAVGRAR